MMADKWLDKAQQVLNKWLSVSTSIASVKVVNENAMDDGRKLRNLIADALHQEHDEAAAEGRRNAIEKSAELVQRQVEAKGGNQ